MMSKIKTLITGNLYIDDNKGIIANSLLFAGSGKKRKIKDRIFLNNVNWPDYKDHSFEECRLSLKITKLNLELDPKNRYYLDQYNKAKEQYEIEIKKYKNIPQ